MRRIPMDRQTRLVGKVESNLCEKKIKKCIDQK